MYANDLNIFGIFNDLNDALVRLGLVLHFRVDRPKATYIAMYALLHVSFRKCNAVLP